MMEMPKVIELLYQYGHFRNPSNYNRGDSWNVKQPDLKRLTASSPSVKDALASYQEFNSQTLDTFTQQMHRRPCRPDGDFGPATDAMFNLARCACPDYPMTARMGAKYHTEEAAGSGSWPAGCSSEFPKHHSLNIFIDKAGMPAFLENVFESHVWPAVFDAFLDIGLALFRVDSLQKANLHSQFVTPDGNWIGLAIVPGNTSCNLRIWNRYDKNWRPINLVNGWILLFLHEIGHNLRLNHSRGGIMNSYLLSGLEPTWKGDSSQSIIEGYFSGERFPLPEPGPKVWTHHGFWDEHTGDKELYLLRPPLPRN